MGIILHISYIITMVIGIFTWIFIVPLSTNAIESAAHLMHDITYHSNGTHGWVVDSFGSVLRLTWDDAIDRLNSLNRARFRLPMPIQNYNASNTVEYINMILSTQQYLVEQVRIQNQIILNMQEEINNLITTESQIIVNNVTTNVTANAKTDAQPETRLSLFFEMFYIASIFAAGCFVAATIIEFNLVTAAFQAIPILPEVFYIIQWTGVFDGLINFLHHHNHMANIIRMGGGWYLILIGGAAGGAGSDCVNKFLTYGMN